MDTLKCAENEKYSLNRVCSGSEFDSSRKRNRPFEFSLGFGEVVPGFEKAVLGMSVGEKKSSTFPPEDGYGKPRAEMM